MDRVIPVDHLLMCKYVVCPHNDGVSTALIMFWILSAIEVIGWAQHLLGAFGLPPTSSLECYTIKAAVWEPITFSVW